MGINARAQGLYGFEAGLGKTTSFKGKLVPEFKGYILGCITRHLYAGGGVDYERYSFTRTSDIAPAGVKFGDVLYVRSRTSFLYFYPKVDLGIGYRQYVHINANFGAGVYMGGGQWANKYEPYWTTSTGTFGKDTITYNTASRVPQLMLRYGIGLSERIPTHGYWNIILSQDLGIMTRSLNKDMAFLKSNYIAFSIGVSHKYPMVIMED